MSWTILSCMSDTSTFPLASSRTPRMEVNGSAYSASGLVSAIFCWGTAASVRRNRVSMDSAWQGSLLADVR